MNCSFLRRLVYVREVDIQSGQLEGSGLRPPAGHTELPTCPVCLERLDEHVSGVVTTVSRKERKRGSEAKIAAL